MIVQLDNGNVLVVGRRRRIKAKGYTINAKGSRFAQLVTAKGMTSAIMLRLTKQLIAKKVKLLASKHR